MTECKSSELNWTDWRDTGGGESVQPANWEESGPPWKVQQIRANGSNTKNFWMPKKQVETPRSVKKKTKPVERWGQHQKKLENRTEPHESRTNWVRPRLDPSKDYGTTEKSRRESQLVAQTPITDQLVSSGEPEVPQNSDPTGGETFHSLGPPPTSHHPNHQGYRTWYVWITYISGCPPQETPIKVKIDLDSINRFSQKCLKIKKESLDYRTLPFFINPIWLSL